MPDNFLNDKNDPLVDALRTLHPASPAVTAHDTAFRAGYAAGRRRAALWQTVALVALVLCGVSIFIPQHQSSSLPILQQAQTHPANLPSHEPSAAFASMDKLDTAAIAANLRLRDAVLQHGLGILPHPPADKEPRRPVPSAADLDIPNLSPWMNMQLQRNGNL